MSLSLALDKFNDLLEYLLYISPESIKVCDNDYVLHHYVENVSIAPKFTVEVNATNNQYMISTSLTIGGYAPYGTIPINIIYIYDSYISFDNNTKYKSHIYTRHCERLTELALVQNTKAVDEAVERLSNMTGFPRHNKITNLTKEDSNG